MLFWGKKKFLPEKEFVPFSVKAPPEGINLVLVPHPDDEVFGLGGTLALMSKKDNCKVKVVYVTDGSLQGDLKIRKKEARAAAQILGITDIDFWDFPDRGLSDREKLFKERLKILFEQYQFTTLFLPSFQEYHPDHRALSFFSIDVMKRLGLESDIWLYEINRPGEINCLVDITEVINKKKDAIFSYSSQLKGTNYTEISVAINIMRSLSVAGQGVKYAEGFFKDKASAIFKSYKNRLDKYFL